MLKSIDEDTKLTLNDLEPKQHFTQPPAHYTEAVSYTHLQIFGMQVMPSAYEPITIFILAPGAFFVLACLVAIQNKVKSKKPKKAGEATSGGCGDCSHCGNSACGSRSFFDTTVDDK